MSPSRDTADASPSFGTFGDLNLAITGLGVEYPPHNLEPPALRTLAKRYYPESPAMAKVCAINEFTGIDTRSSIGSADHPIANMDRAPTIAELCTAFMKYGVPLSVTAARKALAEANLDVAQLTHVVSTTCTNSANPGFDHHVCKQLGVAHTVEKVLLHGVGCSGGLAALRTAANLALGATFRGRPARVLVLACEISSIMVRSEMDSINELQQTRIGVCLFSDCASAVVLSNGIGAEAMEEPVYQLLGWEHNVIPDSEEDLGFDVDPLGWKVILSPRVPKLAQEAVSPTFSSLLASLPTLPATHRAAADFDWALHPGGATILSGVEQAMGITPEHMRASYDTYINHGNSSSATVLSVLDRLRCKDMDALAPTYGVAGSRSGSDAASKAGPNEYVVGAAFGPGINVEMCMLRRNLGHQGRRRGQGEGSALAGGEMTPPETESEGSRSDGEEGTVGGATATATATAGSGAGGGPETLIEVLNGVELD